ncbi:AAA family ATPase [Bernardetia sp.]|uniref:AAA family ATPase n=1 Tax=Bernardetia sp. TaxID=1937974 RepID=UPI0025C37381|nr:AAA family ATPase [Bernardetia sp.]
MRITQIHLQNFKRFTDLTIKDIPQDSKLVLLIGANGSGKSSVFDAFVFANEMFKNNISYEKQFLDYWTKDEEKNTTIEIEADEFKITSHDTWGLFKGQTSKPVYSPDSKFIFYGRTSFRQIPRLTRKSLGQQEFDFEKDSDRPKYFIDRDERFENDVEKITGIILNDVFIKKQSGEEINQKYIEPINNSLQNIFGDENGTKLELLSIIPPLDGKVAQINFRKGNTEFHYNQLSAGEKEVVNLLINLISRKDLYQETIYFFDEIDLHLNTKIQYNLLKEITENWIPEKSQLWTASHSLGFIEYAKQSEHASIIDFDSLDFDLPQILQPELKNNPDIYEIAIGKEFLPSIFKDFNLFFVENKDAKLYGSTGIENTVFIAANTRNDVYHKTRTTELKGLVDRDFLSDEDIFLIKENYPKLSILKYYSIENYLYHPDNLEEYYAESNKEFDKVAYIGALVEEKNKVVSRISLRIASERESYPYFGESEFTNKNKELPKRFKKGKSNFEQVEIIVSYLESNDLEVFYKVLPMKDYCKSLEARQNIDKNKLVKTEWFKKQIENIIS